MSWLPILILTALVFALAVFVLKLPRTLWTLFGSALLFGLAGYAAQGNPGQPSAPASPVREDAAQSGELMVEARREFYPEGRLFRNWRINSVLRPLLRVRIHAANRGDFAIQAE